MNNRDKILFSRDAGAGAGGSVNTDLVSWRRPARYCSWSDQSMTMAMKAVEEGECL